MFSNPDTSSYDVQVDLKEARGHEAAEAGAEKANDESKK